MVDFTVIWKLRLKRLLMLLPLILWKVQQIDTAISIFVRQWKKKR